MRCHFCNKKIKGGIEYTCKCQNTFCAKCRLPESHRCTYNFKNDKQKLMKQLVKIEPQKILKI